MLEDAHFGQSQIPQFIEVAALQSIGFDELDYIEYFDSCFNSPVCLYSQLFVNIVDGLLEKEPEEKVSSYQGYGDDTGPAGDINNEDRKDDEYHNVFDEIGQFCGVEQEN